MQIPKSYIAPVVLILLFMVINLINIHQYGLGWDEPIQHIIGKETLEFIKTQDGEKLEAELAKYGSDLLYYGPFIEMINRPVAKLLNRQLGLDYAESHHVLPLFLVSIGLFFIYLFTRRMFNKDIALYALLFLMLFPRFIAHAHYNHKDIPVLIFSAISLFFLYLTFTKKEYKYAVFAGIFFAIVISIKIIGVMVVPIFFFAYAAHVFVNENVKKAFRKDSPLLGIFILTTLVALFVTWPTLWYKPFLPIEATMYFINHIWPGDVTYFGQVYPSSQLPWHYAPVFLALVTPLITLVFFFLGIGKSIQIVRKKKHILEYSLVFLWLFIPLLAEMKPGIIRYDGIRHFFLVVPALAIFAGIGCDHTLSFLKTKLPRYKKYVKPVLLIITFIILMKGIAEVHPFQGSYFNEAVQLAIPSHIENYFDLEYWGVVYRQGMDWINIHAEPNAEVCVPIADVTVTFYPRRSDISLKCSNESDYLMFFPRKSFYKLYGAEDKEPVYIISRYNSDLLLIYKS